MKKRFLESLIMAAAITLMAVPGGNRVIVAEEQNAEETEALAEQNVEEIEASEEQKAEEEEPSEKTEGKEAGTEAPDWEISCNLFSVSVPADIANICDIEAKPDGIAFYEKLSHPTFGGFVGRITTYEDVQDYCYTPNFARGGEIIQEDGKKLDVVLVYPSDVQSDIQNQESVDNWRLIREALDGSIIESLDPADGASYVPQDEVDNTGVYDEILDRLTADLQEKKDADALEADGFSRLYAYLYSGEEDPLTKVGYGFVDMTGTGYPELVIYQKGDGVVYDMFVQTAGEPRKLLSSAERDRYSLSGNGENVHSIREDASGSAYAAEISFYVLDPSTKELYPQVKFIYDDQTDPENPYAVQYASDEEAERMEEKEWTWRMSNFGEVFIPELTMLSER